MSRSAQTPVAVVSEVSVIHVVGYPVEMVLAEKVVTATARGTANTRWRDFVDIAALVGLLRAAGLHHGRVVRWPA